MTTAINLNSTTTTQATIFDPTQAPIVRLVSTTEVTTSTEVIETIATANFAISLDTILKNAGSLLGFLEKTTSVLTPLPIPQSTLQQLPPQPQQLHGCLIAGHLIMWHPASFHTLSEYSGPDEIVLGNGPTHGHNSHNEPETPLPKPNEFCIYLNPTNDNTTSSSIPPCCPRPSPTQQIPIQIPSIPSTPTTPSPSTPTTQNNQSDPASPQTAPQQPPLSSPAQSSPSPVQSPNPSPPPSPPPPHRPRKPNPNDIYQELHVCELRLFSKPNLTLLVTKKFQKFGLYKHEFASYDQKLYVVHPVDPQWIHEISFEELKWESLEKTREEYTFFHNNYFKHDAAVIPYPRSEYGQYGRFDVDTNKGEKGRFMYSNMWYFLHDCLDVNHLDE
ncbi:unnamed protein product [Lactuca virosa]|uniref:Uncharacterized protein n=1 Tax=Lactuca virosa TaxID=75947 RepID=A0AAU9PIJ4_9ASTR|nr:unnamed protein product [Lactuca virosa]